MVAGAAALAVSLIGWFVTPIITKSINAALEYAAETKKSLENVSTNLEKLAKNLDAIKKTVHEVQLCFIKKGEGEEILWGLKGAIDEAVEILDLFEYESLNNKPKGISAKFAPPASRLEKVVDKLDELGKSASNFLQNPNNIIQGSAIFDGRETGPLPRTDFFFGYDKERRRLKGLLKGEQNKVIAIIGHGGMGKTHLARQVFHANQSKFDVRIWVHVGNKSSQIDLLRALCKSAIDKSGSLIPRVRMDSSPTVTGLESMLLGLLKPKGRSEKSCLVVLDDVWQHEDGFGISQTQRNEAWTSVLAILKSLKNCKVVMTTRDKVCSTTLKADETIILDGISSEEIMNKLLLKYIATLPQNCKVVLPQDLADRIAGKLKGSPRAAVSIVDKLSRVSRVQKHLFFRRILEEIKDHHIERLYEDHLFTYRHLPPCLQSCLAFCSMFPYYWKFQREQLTKMWVAHGFIDDDTHQKMTSQQDVAEGYFQDLVGRSLFKQVRDGRYVIHVHIHSMLRRVSRNECLSISKGSSSSEIIVPATVRHLSVTVSCLARLKPEPSLEKAKKVVGSNKKSDDDFRTVRTLLVFSEDKQAPSSPWCCLLQANSILRKFKGVKVVDLTDTGITQLPDSVGELKHLRYLGFPNTVKQPPAHQITKLLLLETVYISKSQSPAADKDMEMSIAKIGGIGQLEKLQGSLEFHVYKKNVKKGHTMSELGKMDSLSGTLSIKGIRAVATKAEAQEAHLEMKAYVQVLKLDWELNQNKNSNADGGKGKGKGNGGAAAAAAVGVLEGLQPHANLLELHITRYPGKDLPKWLCDRKNQIRLYLKSCTELESSVDLKKTIPLAQD